MNKISYRVRPETAVLTRGFDPALSVGSARPPVYRSSTFVFPSSEATELAFLRSANHPNAEIIEEQLVPLERDASAAATFNPGMAAIFTVLITAPSIGSTTSLNRFDFARFAWAAGELIDQVDNLKLR